jgi:hypothetical protein
VQTCGANFGCYWLDGFPGCRASPRTVREGTNRGRSWEQPAGQALEAYATCRGFGANEIRLALYFCRFNQLANLDWTHARCTPIKLCPCFPAERSRSYTAHAPEMLHCNVAYVTRSSHVWSISSLNGCSPERVSEKWFNKYVRSTICDLLFFFPSLL